MFVSYSRNPSGRWLPSTVSRLKLHVLLTLIFDGRAGFAMKGVHILSATCFGLAACVSTGVDVKQEQLSHFMIGFLHAR